MLEGSRPPLLQIEAAGGVTSTPPGCHTTENAQQPDYCNGAIAPRPGRAFLSALSFGEKSGGPGSARMPCGRSGGLEHSAWMEFADGDGQDALPDVPASPTRHRRRGDQFCRAAYAALWPLTDILLAVSNVRFRG